MLKNLLFIAFLALFLAACEGNSSDGTGSKENVNKDSQTQDAGATAGTETEVDTAATSKPVDNKEKESDDIKSIYTGLAEKDCKTLESDTEGAGWYVGECPGVGGYKLQVTEGDIRQSINVIAPNGKKSELNFKQVSSSFSDVGDKAEWRMKGDQPFALIVRFNASKAEDETKNTSYLIVSKIAGGKSCITDVVKPIPNANEQAQKLADDSANKPCKAE